MADTTPEEAKLRIHLPACVGSTIECIETHHSLQETLADVKEALAATSILNHVTHYSLVQGERNITSEFDDFASLEEVFGETGEFSLNLVEKPYTLKDVNEHLLRFRENIGLNFFDHAARAQGVAAGGTKFGSLGLNNVEVTKDAEEAKEDGDEKEEKEPKEEKTLSEEDLASIKSVVNALIEPSPVDLTAFAASESILSQWKLPIKSLTLSQWSVPQSQRTKGDLLYLTLTTLESETFSITCHVSGFFVSRLSSAFFNPAIKVNEKGVSHREYLFNNLVQQLSPQFAEVLAKNKESLSTASQYAELYLIPSQAPVYPWLVTEAQIQQVVPDYSRSQLPILANGVDGAELVKDWNDEFQGIKEFPRETFNERLLRDKLLSKYINEFNHTAITTAVDIVKGNLSPLNPNEPRDKHIFLRNNVFYSFGVNATGAHDLTGGDEAARYCFGKDIAAVKLMNRIDAAGVSNLLSCVVDFLGERVICQAPVPGVFADQVDAEGAPVDKVSYGYSLEAGKIHTSESFDEVLKPVADALHLKSHHVELADASTERELVLSKDTKGIVGTDGRKYVIDLYRSTPLDIDFLDKHFNDSETSYPHKEASVRHEAVEEWYKRRAAAFFKVETERLEKEGKLEGEEKPQVAIPYDQITVNPDAFTGINESKEDQSDVRDLSEFIRAKLVLEFLEDVARNVVPYDGQHLTDYMHKSGINMRYLGALAEGALKRVAEEKKTIEETIVSNEAEIAKREAEKKENEAKDEKKDDENKDEKKDDEKKDDEKKEPEASKAKLLPVIANLTALHNLSQQEMVARAVKHILRKEGKAVPLYLKPHFVAHFHNCLLGLDVNAAPEVFIDEASKSFYTKSELEFVNLTPETVLEMVASEVFKRFRFKLSDSWLSEIKPLPLLREISHKVGIQWKAQNFVFTKEDFEASQQTTEKEVVAESNGKKKSKRKLLPSPVVEAKRATVFVSDDIVNFVPIVKDSSFRCSMLDEVYETARHQINEGEKDVGLALLSELVSFYQQIYGNVHLETTNFYTTLAQVYAECGMSAEASIVARKATVLYERLKGVDGYETINAYVKASFYDSLNKDQVSAFKLNTKAFEDWSVVFGPEHPNSVNTLSSFGTILQELKLDKEAIKFYEKAIELSIKVNGAVSDITGIVRHRLAIVLVQTNDFKGALTQFSEASDIFHKLVGPDDVLSKECSTFVANINTYMAYNEHQAAEKKKQLAQQAKAKAKPVVAAPLSKKKNKKATSDPEIASKSVDEILQFIEGNNKKKNKKKK